MGLEEMKTIMQDLAENMENGEIQCLTVALMMAARNGSRAGKRLRDQLTDEARK